MCGFPGKWDWLRGVETELQGCYNFRLQFCYSSLEVGAGCGLDGIVESKPVTHPMHFSLNNQSSSRHSTPAQIADAQRLSQQCQAQQFKGY